MLGRAVVIVVVVAAWLGGCASGPEPADGEPTSPGSPTASAPSKGASPGMSPSDLPTLPAPTAPPSAPTDITPSEVVAGTVTALAQGCVEITTDDAVVWSLTGEPAVALAVGDTVTAKIEALGADEDACGTGRGARLASLEVAGA